MKDVAKTGRQTTQKMAQKLELSVTGRTPKEAKRNGLNRTRIYNKKKKMVLEMDFWERFAGKSKMK